MAADHPGTSRRDGDPALPATPGSHHPPRGLRAGGSGKDEDRQRAGGSGIGKSKPPRDIVERRRGPLRRRTSNGTLFDTQICKNKPIASDGPGRFAKYLEPRRLRNGICKNIPIKCNVHRQSSSTTKGQGASEEASIGAP